MTGIKIAKEHLEDEQQKQRHWNLVQLQNTWLAVGIMILGLGVAAVSLSQQNWIAVILLWLVGGLICAFSRQIASVIFKRESDRVQNSTNTTTRRVVMPNSLKNLATAAAWVLFILGCICLVCGLAYIVLISFNILSATSPVVLPLVYIGFGILCLILAFVAAWIRRQIE
jgi:heme O synthase-like polyprenyltransferase